MTKIFVSYRRDDSAYVASTIHDRLSERFGAASVYFDIDTIPLGTDFRKHIADHVGQCDVLLAIIGDRWSDAADNEGQRRLDDPGDYVRLEIEAALKRDIPVVPVLVGGAKMPAGEVLPASLQDLSFRNAAEVRAGRDLQQHLTGLVKGVEGLLSPRQKQQETLQETSQHRQSEGAAMPGAEAGRDGASTPRPAAAAPAQQSALRQSPWKRAAVAGLAFVGSFLIGGLAFGALFGALLGGSFSIFMVLLIGLLTGGVGGYYVWKIL